MASASRSTLHRRPVNASSTSSSSAGGPLKLDIDPQPKPPAVLHLLAFGLIAFFACLQFLPATHFRDPNDRYRNWIPLDANRTANTNKVDFRSIHVFSWADCFDLRATVVFVNSTLSNSRLAENVHFHFFVPEGSDEKLSFYKLKVLLPNLKLDIVGHKELKEKLRTVAPKLEPLLPSLREVMPLVIPLMYPSLSRFIYVSSDSMIKGNIEELFGIDLGLYPIAAANNCTSRLGDFVNIDVLDAIQRSITKPWVSNVPYEKNTCVLDLNVLLVDAKKIDELMEAILWWVKVLNLKVERSEIHTAVELALYNRHLILPSVWKLGDYVVPIDNTTNILHYDGPLQACLRYKQQPQGSHSSNIWQQYFDPKADAILAH